ncbi:MAG: GNAT family N-acetyltransferase [Planctomycetota bacterium]
MLCFRTFRNSDPQLLAALWRRRAGERGWLQPMDVELLEQHVFAKLYFDYAGLILAFDDDRPTGFAHASFGPTSGRDTLDHAAGVVCLTLACDDGVPSVETAAELITRCERYLCERGAKVILGGRANGTGPFYLGLYGGSRLPGVLDSDRAANEAFAGKGYEASSKTVILDRPLAQFEAPIDRRQMEIRRRMIVEATVDPPPRDWWDACTLGVFDVTRFDLVSRGGGPPLAWALFRPMETSHAIAGGGSAMGLVELFVQEPYRRRGLAVFLLSEAVRQFAKLGVRRIEAQAAADNEAMLGLYRKLGFQPLEQATVYRKTCPTAD